MFNVGTDLSSVNKVFGSFVVAAFLLTMVLEFAA